MICSFALKIARFSFIFSNLINTDAIIIYDIFYIFICLINSGLSLSSIDLNNYFVSRCKAYSTFKFILYNSINLNAKKNYSLFIHKLINLLI